MIVVSFLVHTEKHLPYIPLVVRIVAQSYTIIQMVFVNLSLRVDNKRVGKNQLRHWIMLMTASYNAVKQKSPYRIFITQLSLIKEKQSNLEIILVRKKFSASFGRNHKYVLFRIRRVDTVNKSQYIDALVLNRFIKFYIVFVYQRS